MGMDHIAPLLILGLSCALIGCSITVITSRIERQRQERHVKDLADHQDGTQPNK
jgi:uncharacterized membrane protein YciS (DUF1049 family)